MLDPIVHSLGFNVNVFLMQVVLFVVLWILMSHLFWNPVLARLRQRDQDIANAYKAVSDTQHEMEALRADYLARISPVEAEARARIQAAIREAQAERERILAEARAQTEETLQRGIAAIEREKEEALQALTAASKALGSAADPITLRHSIEERRAHSVGNGANHARQ